MMQNPGTVLILVALCCTLVLAAPSVKPTHPTRATGAQPPPTWGNSAQDEPPPPPPPAPPPPPPAGVPSPEGTYEGETHILF